MDIEQIFDHSYYRVLKPRPNQPSFFEAFYNRFVHTDNRVAELFKNTDMELQRRILEKSFYRLMGLHATNCAEDYLEPVAIRHNRSHLNIPPDLYDLWLDTLMLTLADYDPEFCANTELAWRLVLSSGITYMKFKYNEA